MENLVNCTVAMLDMDNHMVAADVDMKVTGRAARAMFVQAQCQRASSELGTPSEVEVVELCWKLEVMHGTTEVMS
jgi:hypothetical protein